MAKPKHFESTCDKEVWLRKAASGKEENFLTFQGKQRILYNIFNSTYNWCPDTHGTTSALPGESEKTWGVWRTVTPHLATRLS